MKQAVVFILMVMFWATTQHVKAQDANAPKAESSNKKQREAEKKKQKRLEEGYKLVAKEEKRRYKAQSKETKKQMKQTKKKSRKIYVKRTALNTNILNMPVAPADRYPQSKILNSLTINLTKLNTI